MTPEQARPAGGGALGLLVRALDTLTRRTTRRLAEIEARVAQLESRSMLRFEGIWEPGRRYRPGNVVTHGGSMWVTSGETTDQPGAGATSWLLCVKHGRDLRRDR